MENFSLSLKKLLCTSKFEGKSWKNEIYKFLHLYRNTPHTTTEVSPAELMFNRKLKTYVPETPKQISHHDNKIRQKQDQKYEKVKQYTDKVRRAKPSKFNIGDAVLMKRTER